MSHEPTLAEADNPKMLIIVGALVVVLAVIVVICAGVDQFYKFQIRDEISSKILEPQNPQLRELRAAEKRALHTYQYIDKSAGTVRIPVDVAASLMLADWQKAAPANAPTPTPAPAAPAPAPHH